MPMTKDEFDRIFPGTKFAQGKVMDGTPHFNITGKQQMLRWVAVKGYADDWCVYVGLEYWHPDEVAKKGDKIHTKPYIQYAVPCTEEVYNRYRH